MKIFNKLKEKSAILSLKKELKSAKRTVAFNNFESSTTVGFIFNTADRQNYQLSRDFIEFVEKMNNRIFGIGFSPKSDQIAYFPYKQGIDYFGLDEVNWYGKPKSPVIKDFLKRNFDILVDLSFSDNYSTIYLFSLSNAKFKITNKSVKTNFADFVIEIDNSGKLDEYITQLKHYLKVIQAKQTQ